MAPTRTSPLPARRRSSSPIWVEHLSSRLILASRSPQRRAILTQLGIPFDVVVPDVEELTSGDPVDVVCENARRKAEAVSSPLPVLGVDTVVVLNGAIYGKPADADEARDVLERLDGRIHEVVSGVAVARGGTARRAVVATTRVHFRPLDAATLDWYLATEEWRERAGGYAIQGRGAALVAEIEGDYLNVVGLPLAPLFSLLPGILQPAS
jgi:septum formation protein